MRIDSKDIVRCLERPRRLRVGFLAVTRRRFPSPKPGGRLPSSWAKFRVVRWGIRRYGFHGISCAWAARRSAELLGVPASRLRLVVCHLGAGASASALNGGRSADTTIRFGAIRAEACADLDWLGVRLDREANEAVEGTDAAISNPAASVRTLVVHAREDMQIAHECRQLLDHPQPGH